jgi:hypothetical protein
VVDRAEALAGIGARRTREQLPFQNGNHPGAKMTDKLICMCLSVKWAARIAVRVAN